MCAALNVCGWAHAVCTADVDALLFGALTVYRQLHLQVSKLGRGLGSQATLDTADFSASVLGGVQGCELCVHDYRQCLQRDREVYVLTGCAGQNCGWLAGH